MGDVFVIGDIFASLVVLLNCFFSKESSFNIITGSSFSLKGRVIYDFKGTKIEDIIPTTHVKR